MSGLAGVLGAPISAIGLALLLFGLACLGAVVRASVERTAPPAAS